MNLITRVKNILLQPKAEWPTIAAESATPQSIYVGYVMILAAIGPLALLLRMGIVAAIAQYLITLVVTFLLALIVDALATIFGGEKNFVQSLKLVAYSYTAVWLAGVFRLIPGWGVLIGLLAMIYVLYTFYLGVPILKKCPQTLAALYTIVVMICAILLGFVLADMLMVAVIGSGLMG